MVTRLAGLSVLLLALAASPAGAVTVDDLVELAAAGVGDDVLVELIQLGGERYDLPAARVRELKADGVSDRVLLALLRSGRPRGGTTSPALGATEPTRSRCMRAQVGACGATLVVVPVPITPRVVVRATGRSSGTTRTSGPGVTGFAIGPLSTTTSTQSSSDGPVYWGWGGKKRPGSWNGHSGRD